MTDYKKIADLIYPHAKPIQYYIDKYKPRNLKNGAFVTRFAPSPTGYVHFGGFFQAVLDSHLAKQTGGVYFLRIEDTDTERKIDDAMQTIVYTLNRYNLPPDEGVDINGKEYGNYGPYVQSERMEIYAAFAKYLISTGNAYPCFCTKADEEEMRKAQGDKSETGYFGKYRKCDKLTSSEIEENLKNKKPFTIRFRSKSSDLSEKILVQDAVRGELSLQRWFKDDVLLKSNGGLPVYAFAEVVDDYLMGTNLVIRGSEWLSTYALHVELWNAFNFPIPKFLHTLLLFKKDGNGKIKLSKRYHPEAKMSYYEENGYPVLSCFEYCYTLINSNFEEWRKQNPTADLLTFNMTFEKMNPSEALFDIDKLNDISKTVISRMKNTELYENALAYFNKYDKTFAIELTKNKQKWLNILNIDRDNDKPRKDIAFYKEIPATFHYFISQPAARNSYNDLNKADIKAIADSFIQTYQITDDKEVWWKKVKSAAETLNYATDNKLYKQNPASYKGNVSDFASVIRLLITGEQNSPDLYQILKILGEIEIKERLFK